MRNLNKAKDWASISLGIIIFITLLVFVVGGIISWFAGLWGLASGPTTGIKVICWVICLPISFWISFAISIYSISFMRKLLG